MTTDVKGKTSRSVPIEAQRVGLKPGDRVEFRVSGGIINIIPRMPFADDEYTPVQRRRIDARLAVAEKGRYYGPFATADEALGFLRKEIKRRKTTRRETT